ncbi:unnamed protein product [Prorocentrum cordatum]|uniref:Uncharacterized protein n=1 Tax=Prorocentrum cordatum TaxID=2364126 RepID=A0ABN9PYA4_9DINO|nr:unnamed protein product [Polarella glacialis]
MAEPAAGAGAQASAAAEESLLKQRQLLERAKYEGPDSYIYHAAQRRRWDEAKIEQAQIYYPPTFAQDGEFTHATADAKKLLGVLNHFYSESSGPEQEWVLLQMTIATVESCEVGGVPVEFEPGKPVGDKASAIRLRRHERVSPLAQSSCS